MLRELGGQREQEEAREGGRDGDKDRGEAYQPRRDNQALKKKLFMGKCRWRFGRW